VHANNVAAATLAVQQAAAREQALQAQLAALQNPPQGQQAPADDAEAGRSAKARAEARVEEFTKEMGFYSSSC